MGLILMKVIFLAGCSATCLSESTNLIPKLMVPVEGGAILWRIMQAYESFGRTDFYVALWRKAKIIKDYFLECRSLNADISFDITSGSFKSHQVGLLIRV